MLHITKIYKVHKFEISIENDQELLAHFLNAFEGEMVSIIPNIKKRPFFKSMELLKKLIFFLLWKKLIKGEKS